MKILQILDLRRQILAKITLEAPDRAAVEAPDPTLRSEITAFVERARLDGLPYRTGSHAQQEGRTRIIERRVKVGPEDERFLPALADAINRTTFGGQRIFCLLREVEEGSDG